jgi:hypothetical protein
MKVTVRHVQKNICESYKWRLTVYGVFQVYIDLLVVITNSKQQFQKSLHQPSKVLALSFYDNVTNKDFNLMKSPYIYSLIFIINR